MLETLGFVIERGWGLFPRRSGVSGVSRDGRTQITQSREEAEGTL